MQIRAMGYRTIFQPKSVIIHFEGISHGTDLSDGIKSNQPLNQQRFLEKWKEELEKNNYFRNENTFRARDKSKHKRVVLLVDYSVPSSSLRVNDQKYLQIVNSFLAKGLKVTIMPENFYKSDPETAELEQMGIEVLYGGWYRENWILWIHENAAQIDTVIFIDDLIANKYGSIFKNIPNARYKMTVINHDMEFDIMAVLS